MLGAGTIAKVGQGIRLFKENRRAREAGGACWRSQARGSGTNEENAVVISASAIFGSCESCPGKSPGCKRERDRNLSPVYYWQRCATDRNLWTGWLGELPLHADP